MRPLLAAAFALMTCPALAASCDDLFTERAQIFKHAGYCFKSQRAVSRFGNAGCTYRDVDDLPLSASERAAIGRIDEQERAQSCSW